MICKNCKGFIPDKSYPCPKCNKFPFIIDADDAFKDCKYLPAKWWKRLLNYLLDIFFYYVYVFILAFIFAVFSVKLHTGNQLKNIIITIVLMMLYYIIPELLFSRSFGKFITGTHIVRYDGRKPDLKDVLIRTISRFIPFEAFSLLSGRPIGWHDLLAKTLVVEKNKNLS